MRDSTDEQDRIRALYDHSGVGGQRPDYPGWKPQKEPLPEPRLPELRQLIRWVCALERGGLSASEEFGERQLLRENVRIEEGGLDPMLPGDILASVNAACRAARLCIYEGQQEVVVLDRCGNRVRIQKEHLTEASGRV